MSPLDIELVREELDYAELHPVDPNGSGPGVQALCPCCPGMMVWRPEDPRYRCQGDGCDPSRIADEVFSRAERVRARETAEHLREMAARQNGTAPKTKAPSPDRYAGRLFSPQAMTERLRQPEEPVDWRVIGLVADGTHTLVAGGSGSGKSALLQALCVGVQRGEMTAGFHCMKGTALYIDGEMGTKMFNRRLRSMGYDHCPFWYVDGLGLDIGAAKLGDLEWVREKIEQVAANFVVLDSLRMLMSSKSENDSDDMAPALGSITALSRTAHASIVTVHHRGDGDKFYRGSSAIKDQVDALFGLVPAAPDDDNDLTHRLSCRPPRGKFPRYDGEQSDRHLIVDFANGGVSSVGAPESAGPTVPIQAAVAEAIKAALPAKTKTEVAQKLGRARTDVTLGKAWAALEKAGEIARINGIWEVSYYSPALGIEGNTTSAETAAQSQIGVYYPGGACSRCGATLTETPNGLVCVGCESGWTSS